MSADFHVLGSPGLSSRDAPVVKQTIDRIIAERGRLSSRELQDELIKRSRPAGSPTHHLFEWDAKKGHAIYLRDRAYQIIASVRIVLVAAPKTKLRAFPVVVSAGKRGPMAISRVLSDRALTEAHLEEAKQQARQWADRYRQLSEVAAELKPVFRAIAKLH